MIDGVQRMIHGGDGGLSDTDDRMFIEQAPAAQGTVEHYPADWRWGHEWTRNLPNLMVYSVGRPASGDVVLAGLQDNGTILASDGTTYDEVGGGDGFDVFVSDEHENDMMLSANGYHFRSEDGAQFQLAETGLPTPKPFFEEPFTMFYGALPHDPTLNPNGEAVIIAPNQGTAPLTSGCVYLTKNVGLDYTPSCGTVDNGGSSTAGHLNTPLATVATHPRQANVWGTVDYTGTFYVTTDAGAHDRRVPIARGSDLFGDVNDQDPTHQVTRTHS